MELLAVAVYNPTLTSSEERAHENIIAYHPATTPLNQQMNEVGLCIALTSLASRFSTTEETSESPSAVQSSGVSDRQRPLLQPQHRRRRRCESVTTARRRYVITPLEGDFHCAVICSREAVEGFATRRLPSLAPTRRKAGTAPPALEDDADDRWTTVIEQEALLTYSAFRLLFGSLCAIFAKLRTTTTSAVTQRRMRRVVMNGFLRKLVLSLTTLLRGFPTEGSMASPPGVEYTPITDGRVFLVVSCMISEIFAAHPGAVANAVVLHGGKVLYSTLDAADTTALFKLMHQPTLASHGETAAGRTGSVGGADSAAMPCPLWVAADGLAAAPSDSEDNDADAERAGADIYSPAALMRSEPRRSTFFQASARQHQRGTRYAGYTEELDASAATVAFPYIFINGEPAGVVSYHLRGLLLLLLVTRKFLEHPQLRRGLLESLRKTLAADRYQAVADQLSPAMVSSKGLDERFCYFYANETNAAVKSSVVGSGESGGSATGGTSNVNGGGDGAAAGGGDGGGGGGGSAAPRGTSHAPLSPAPSSPAAAASWFERLHQRAGGSAAGGTPGAPPSPQLRPAIAALPQQHAVALRPEVREGVRRMDMARAFLRDVWRGSSQARQETLIRVSSDTWVYLARLAHREFLLVIEAPSLPEAVAQAEFVCRCVFVGLFTS